MKLCRVAGAFMLGVSFGSVTDLLMLWLLVLNLGSRLRGKSFPTMSGTTGVACTTYVVPAQAGTQVLRYFFGRCGSSNTIRPRPASTSVSASTSRIDRIERRARS